MENSCYQQRKLALIDEITAAFDGVSRENGVSISESWVIDDYGSDAERAEARKQDTETRWQDVPDEDICYGYSCLSFLDEIGFHYYIPAYMVWGLRHMDNEDPDAPSFNSNTFEWLLYALTMSNDKNLVEYKLSRYRIFTPEQSKAIAHFLKFQEERGDALLMEWELPEDTSNDARLALERYWGQFL